jgi:NAD-dependent dihydropyrimidine dehydrogenase PreA subunit
MAVLKIDNSKCVGCKKCYNVCPMDVFTWDAEAKRPVFTYEAECWLCGICWMDCGSRAIDIKLPASNW